MPKTRCRRAPVTASTPAVSSAPRRHATVEERVRAVTRVEFVLETSGGPVIHAIKMAAAHLNVPVNTLRRWYYKAKGGGTQQRAPGGRGVSANTKKAADWLVQEHLPATKGMFTVRSAAAASRTAHGLDGGVSKTTMVRIIKDTKLRRVPRGARRLLTPAHIAARLSWVNLKLAQLRKRARGRDVFARVHLDEKNYVAHRPNAKQYVIEGHPRSPRKLLSKSNATQVTFLTVAGEPDDTFDGKVLNFRVVRKHVAERNSRWHRKGDVYHKDSALDGALFFDTMKEKVLPAVSEAYAHRLKSRGSRFFVELQMDGATPHVGGNNIDKLNKIGEALRPPVKVVKQPAQSPDVNVCALALYAHWASRVEKINGDNDAANRLVDAVQQAWADTTSEDVGEAFKLLDATYKSIKAANGSNDYPKPRPAPPCTTRN